MKKYIHALKSVSEALWIYLLLVWAYISVENLITPATVANDVFAVYFPVKQNILVLVSFALSFVFFVIWRYLSKE